MMTKKQMQIVAMDDAAESKNVSLNEFCEMIEAMDNEMEPTIASVEDFNDFLRTEAEALGLETEAPDGKWFRFTRIKSDYVNVTVWEDSEGFDMEKRTFTIGYRVSASISTMGGNPTVEELLKASDEIRKAAMLMETVNAHKITIEKRF